MEFAPVHGRDRDASVELPKQWFSVVRDTADERAALAAAEGRVFDAATWREIARLADQAAGGPVA